MISYDLFLGVSVGMGMPDLQEIYETGRSLADSGSRTVSPFFIPRNLVNMASGHISIDLGFQVCKCNSSLCKVCVGSNHRHVMT